MFGLASRKKKAAAKPVEAIVPGTVAIVSKGAEKIPVQLKDEAHLAKLRSDFGDSNVVVQS